MKILRNRTVLGIICITVSLIICFAVTPLVNKGLSSKTTIVRVKANLRAGSMLSSDVLESVEVGKYNLPEGVIKDISEVEGKYLTADLLTGDYILVGKVSETPAKENEYLYHLNGDKQAMSISINSFAEGVSGKLMSGDIVSVIVADFNGSGQTVIPTELKYVEVIAVTSKSGYDANTETGREVKREDEEEVEDKELPDTVTVLVTPEQSKILAMLEQESEIHLSLVYRGDEKTAKKFIKAQDEVLDEIQKLFDELAASDVEYKQIGATGTTVVTGYTSINQSSIISQGNRIATSDLPADASLGEAETNMAGQIIGEE